MLAIYSTIPSIITGYKSLYKILVVPILRLVYYYDVYHMHIIILQKWSMLKWSIIIYLLSMLVLRF